MCVCVLAVVCCLVADTAATDQYVSGTPATFSSIRNACVAANPGDTVTVNSSVVYTRTTLNYDGIGLIGSDFDGLTLQSDGAVGGAGCRRSGKVRK